jgi:molybdopterin converting factor small subunit
MIETMLDEPVVTVHIPQSLRDYTKGADETTVSGLTVGEALAALERQCPGIRAAVMTPEGAVRPEFEIFLGGTPVEDLFGLETPIGFEELVAIVPANQGARL